ncbi:MAG: flavodoxin family protein [Planctomycetaceae bacterium]|nr:flavodoxin family protein [Planctomycetaceae bacterium]
MEEGDSSKTPRTAIVFASVHHGNTRRIAETLALELSADLFSVDDVTSDLDEYDVIGVGSGIYFGRHHRTIRQAVTGWRPRRVFLFSTAGLPFLRYFQHASLRRILRKQGWEIVGEFCCRGWDTVGPLWLFGGINRKRPNNRDLEHARSFAAKIRAAIDISQGPNS